MLRDYITYLQLQPESGARQPIDDKFSGHKWSQIYKFKTIYLGLIINALESGEADLQTGDGYLKDFNIQPERAYTKLTVTYSSIDDAGDMSPVHILNQPQYFLTWIQDDIPVERLSNYKACWNNLLAASSETDTAFRDDRVAAGIGYFEVDVARGGDSQGLLREGRYRCAERDGGGRGRCLRGGGVRGGLLSHALFLVKMALGAFQILVLCQ